MYNHHTSIEFIESRFTEFADDLHEEVIDELLHLQMAEFSQMAQNAIDQHNETLWREVIDTFLVIWRDCTPEVTNALNVSFLEHLRFNDGKTRRSWAYKAMPQSMRKAWNEMNDYNRRLYGG